MPFLETPQSRCRLGLARVDVTPPVGIYHRMWGAASHDRATGVHRALTATALVFQPDTEGETPARRASEGTAPALAGASGWCDGLTQLLLALDHCFLPVPQMNALLKAITRGTGLAREQVIVSFSHTHGSGLMGQDRWGLPGGELIPPYLERVVQTSVELVLQALRTLQPVTLVYGRGHCALAGQRDFWDEQSRQWVCGFNPGGFADDTVLVVRAVDRTGTSVVTLVNYACHPTTLAWQNTLLSPDYVGAMREVVEKETGAPIVFTQGASGDLGPREGFVGDPAVADRNGRQLGYAVLSTLEALPPPGTRFEYTGPVVSGATLGTWAHVPLDLERLRRLRTWRWESWTVDLPYRPELPTSEQTESELARWQSEETAAQQAGDTLRARDCRAMVERMTRWLARLATLPAGRVFPLPVTLGQLGDALWLAVEGEHYQVLQTTLRQRFPGVPIIVITVANGARPTYLPPREIYGKGIYQESIAVLAPGCLEKLIDTIGERIQQWLSRE
jgi:hypothetical protein